MSTSPAPQTILDHVDVLIVGAGLSGIGMGCHLRRLQPGKTFEILEARDAIGGTWDIFRYPGVRSDADLYAFGYGFKTWNRDNSIADASEIVDYLQETVDEYDLGPQIHLGHKVVDANFSTTDARWTVTVERRSDGERFTMTCTILSSAAGYYDTDQGYTPHFEGREDFAGQIVHPQQWPEDLDHTGKNVVIVGSGATAVTAVPAMAETAGHVTMLQRSPTYILSVPRQDPLPKVLRKVVSDETAHKITRKVTIARQNFFVKVSGRFPSLMRAFVRKVNADLLPDGYDVDTHFSPDYAPWDQRMCIATDGDLFAAISSGKASVVTDHITRFTKKGILLESGTELEADIIVTATGLSMVPFGRIPLRVDGATVDLHDELIYKTLMVSNIPNFIFTIGYTVAAWTLKADLVAAWTCRLLAHMDRHGYTTVTPRIIDDSIERRPYLEMTSGYVDRAMHLFPQRGTSGPWTVTQDYKVDRQMLAKDPIEDPALSFSRVGAPQLVASA